jgi:hypothetical protein
MTMNVLTLSLVVVVSLASLGVSAWIWMSLNSVSESLAKLELEGMRFDIE